MAPRNKLKGRNKRGHFAKGNTVAKGNGGSLGKIGPNYRHGVRNPADRIRRDVKIHGERGVALDTILNGEQEFSRRLNEFRTHMIASLGGIKALSPMALEVLNLVITDKLILNSGDAWLRDPEHKLIDPKSQSYRALVLQRDKLATGFIYRLKALKEMCQQQTPEDDDLEAVLRGEEP